MNFLVLIFVVLIFLLLLLGRKNFLLAVLFAVLGFLVLVSLNT